MKVRHRACIMAIHSAVHDAGATSAHQLYQKELNARKIITFCGDLDSMLGGGVATGQITEFCKHTLFARKEACGTLCC